MLTSKFENRSTWIKPDEKKIFSLLPGTIVKIEVKKGDKVKSGQKLLVMEAMKMLNLVRSDQNGIIKDVYVKPGDKISKNMFMLEFE
jgi:biotin carboxyl carrier protein